MAGETTPPGGATRFIQTTRGLLSYSQLAPLLAGKGQRNVRQGNWDDDASFIPLTSIPLTAPLSIRANLRNLRFNLFGDSNP